MRPSFALEQIVLTLTQANRYLEEKAPWKTAKDNLEEAGHVLATALEVLRVVGVLLSPVIPQKSRELLTRIGVNESPAWDQLAKWPGLAEGATIRKGEPLFPRLDFKAHQ